MNELFTPSPSSWDSEHLTATMFEPGDMVALMSRGKLIYLALIIGVKTQAFPWSSFDIWEIVGGRSPQVVKDNRIYGRHYSVFRHGKIIHKGVVDSVFTCDILQTL